MCCQQGDSTSLSYRVTCIFIQGTGKTSGNKIFLEHLAALEKEEKAMHDKKVVGSSASNKEDSASDQVEEVDDDDDGEDLTPTGPKKRRVKESRNKTKKKSASDEGREDADCVERQMFHAKQVNKNCSMLHSNVNYKCYRGL